MSDYESQRTFNIGGTLHTFVFRCGDSHHPQFRAWYVEWADKVNKIVLGIQHGGY